LPIVLATATPKRKGPANSQEAVIRRAVRGASALDEIIVETMFELSWKPFRKSKTTAVAMKTMMVVDTILLASN
jgi:hypothetical protein